MATIKISDLHPTGSELFSDSESYMTELADSDLDIVNGGGTPAILVGLAIRGLARSTYRCYVAFTVITRPR